MNLHINYNKVLKCTNINSKLIYPSLLVYNLCIVYIKNIIHGMCHHVFMCDRRDKNTNSQISSSIKCISNTHEGVI